MSTNKIGQVISSSPDSILVDIKDLKTYEENKDVLQIGRFLKIAQGNNDYVIAIIKNIKGSHSLDANQSIVWSFIIECQAIGSLIADKDFERSSTHLPVPTEPVFVTDKTELDKLFLSNDIFNFQLGNLVLNKNIAVNIHGDKFFGQHIAIVGSSGSGKSCTVAKIIQEVVGITDGKNKNLEKQNNSHIVIFDIHSEYENAFTLLDEQKFTLNCLNVDKLKLPYWLMNSEELEDLFIESREENSHNQVSQFKQAVILNKEKYNPTITEMTYDNPVYFSIEEIFNYIENMNREVISKIEGDNLPKLSNTTLVNDKKVYFNELHNFVSTSTAKADKASNGPFHGDFNRFVSRLENKLSDKRLKFLLEPKKTDGTPYKTSDFEEIMKQFLGYLNKSNITIVDLSGVPFEVLSITVSLISRLIFDFCFHYSKIKHDQDEINDIPVMLVCEEAHNYVPRNDSAMYKASRKSIERIAKEGRKYGLNLMVVSQRPSEVSETIFAQCNNFLSLRLSNYNDQNYIKNLLPDNSNAITDILPNLAPGECIVVGDCIAIPSILKIDMPNPEPKSQSVKVLSEWNKDWLDVTFEDVIKRWRKE
jgi:hypothetical protein